MEKRYAKNAVMGDDVMTKSIDSRKMRSYDIVSHTDSKVLQCTKSSFHMVLSIYSMDRERLCQNLIQKVPIMRNWPLMKIINASDRFVRKSFEPGQLIYDIGGPSDKVYFIYQGLV